MRRFTIASSTHPLMPFFKKIFRGARSAPALSRFSKRVLANIAVILRRLRYFERFSSEHLLSSTSP